MKKLLLTILLLSLSTLASAQILQTPAGVGIGPGFAPMQRGSSMVQVPSGGLLFAGVKGKWTFSDATHIATWTNQISGGHSFYQDVGVSQPEVGPNGGLIFQDGDWLKISPDLFAGTIASMTIIYKGKHSGTYYYNMIFGRADANGGSEGVVWQEIFPTASNCGYVFRYGANTVQFFGCNPPTASVGIWGAGYDASVCAAFNGSQFVTKANAGPVALEKSAANWVIGDWPLRGFDLQAEVTDLFIYGRLLTESEIVQIRRALE